jgi:hypothetical protein
MSYFPRTPDTTDKALTALNFIREEYGDSVSIRDKAKPLRKWGENPAVDTTSTVIMTMKLGIQEETMITTNGITTVVSSSTSDTMDIDFYEGHAISGGLLANSSNTRVAGGMSGPLALIV